jgi:hypothetical protein
MEFGMENQISERPEVDGLLDLGMVLGQNQAFGFLAGRCSAAQAEALGRLRNERLYKRVTEQWNEFCPQYLRMSGTQADRIIHHWEEFGAGYFEMTQLTRVSPDTYRLLEPAIHDGVLNANGEQIQLTIENSRKVAAVVSEIRRAQPSKQPAPAAERALDMADRIGRLDQLCATVIEEFSEIPSAADENHKRLRELLQRMQSALSRLRKEMRM